jgi:Na+:H+ antiporter, NhaA family
MNEFLKKESAGGILLMIAAVVAIILANSPLEPLYRLLLSTEIEIRVGTIEIAKPLLLWINDGLMAVFFFLVGLELKRELIEGELSDYRNIVLPGIGAVGGMLVPAAIYAMFNSGDSVAMKGWAIPAATDIAFALGILALIGDRVPLSIKVFLTSLAIFDDVGAILIIAFFYTAHISAEALLVAAACIAVLFTLNRRGVIVKSPYIMIGIVMWVATLKSGLHATLAGVCLALFIPFRDDSSGASPLKEMEHDLHHVVAFFILPVFAFANAGIHLSGISAYQVFHDVPMGIAAGLFIGKQLGIFGLCFLAVKIGLANLPSGMSFLSLYGTATLCGVGFTMSLFIGSLAFEETGVNLLFDERLGIILGSIASGIVGCALLRLSLGSNK